MRNQARSLAMFVGLTALSWPARAQPQGDAGATAATSVEAAPAASGTGAPANGQAPAEPEPTSRNVVGHSFSDGPRPAAIRDDRRPTQRSAKGKAALPDAPIATFPGFELLPDGGSRVFVQVTKHVAVEEKRAVGSITYVLKGAHVVKRNNTNPLVTLHWNTPVAGARLVPSGHDLHFVIALRAEAAPAWKVVQANDGPATLQIDFPRGNYVPGAGDAPSVPPAGDSSAAAPDMTTERTRSADGRPAGAPAASTASKKARVQRLTPPPPKRTTTP